MPRDKHRKEHIKCSWYSFLGEFVGFLKNPLHFLMPSRMKQQRISLSVAGMGSLDLVLPVCLWTNHLTSGLLVSHLDNANSSCLRVLAVGG